MANNYSQATLEPMVHMTKQQQRLLEATCGGVEAYDDLFYVYWEESWSEDKEEWLENLDPCEDGARETGLTIEEWRERVSDWGLEDIFRWILKNPENSAIEALDFSGAHTCSKMRPGEFGGFRLLVTRDGYCWMNNTSVTVTDGKLVAENPLICAFENG